MQSALHELSAFGVSDYQIRQLRKLRSEFQPYEKEFQRQAEKYNMGYKTASYRSYLSYLRGHAEQYDRYSIQQASREYRSDIRTDIETYEETGYTGEVHAAASGMAEDFNRLFSDYGIDMRVDADTILNLNDAQITSARNYHDVALQYDEVYKEKGSYRAYETVLESLHAFIGLIS